MVYAYDLWLQMPTKDLFDTLMMLASVNAAKDMYEKGLEEMKEFNKEYGDFYSPIYEDMQWVLNNVLDPTRSAIDAMYESGIDPLRSKEGRALLYKLRNNIDLGRMARNKQSAKNAELYLKNVAELKSKGLYDPDYESWRLGGNTLDKWDSGQGIWNETSAMPLRDIDSIVEPWVSNLEPSFDPEYTKTQNDGYDYSTVSGERIRAVIDDQLPEFSKSSEGGYYRHLAEVAADGDPILADLILKEWMYNRASDHTRVSREINPERKMALEDYYNARETLRQADKEIDVYLQKKIIDAMYSGGSGGGSDDVSIDPLMRIYQDSVTNVFGLNYDLFEAGTADSPSKLEKEIFELQKNIISQSELAGVDVLLPFSRQNAITLKMFAGAADALKRINNDEDGITATRSDIKKLKTKTKLLNNIAGNKHKLVGYNTFEEPNPKDLLSGGDYSDYIIHPTKVVTGALMKNGKFETYAEVELLHLDSNGLVDHVFPGYYYDLDLYSELAADYKNSQATLLPSPENEHSRLARSREIAGSIYHTKAKSDDMDLIPETSYPNQ